MSSTEQTLSDCYQPVLFKDLETSVELGQDLLTVHIQVILVITLSRDVITPLT